MVKQKRCPTRVDDSKENGREKEETGSKEMFGSGQGKVLQ